MRPRRLELPCLSALAPQAALLINHGVSYRKTVLGISNVIPYGIKNYIRFLVSVCIIREHSVKLKN
jgi:hypothetical protein